jgi:hypothetical protein
LKDDSWNIMRVAILIIWSLLYFGGTGLMIDLMIGCRIFLMGLLFKVDGKRIPTG